MLFEKALNTISPLGVKTQHIGVDVALSQEGRSLVRARAAGVDAPLLLFVDTICYRLFMERINGITVKEFLRSRSYSSSGERGTGFSLNYFCLFLA